MMSESQVLSSLDLVGKGRMNSKLNNQHGVLAEAMTSLKVLPT